MVGIGRASVVCFVVDTTGSMGDDIAEVQRIINKLIDKAKGTQDEPSEYILVPFNDPGKIYCNAFIAPFLSRSVYSVKQMY